eukprot:1358853-Amphidinium_carterae.1
MVDLLQTLLSTGFCPDKDVIPRTIVAHHRPIGRLHSQKAICFEHAKGLVSCLRSSVSGGFPKMARAAQNLKSA